MESNNSGMECFPLNSVPDGTSDSPNIPEQQQQQQQQQQQEEEVNINEMNPGSEPMSQDICEQPKNFNIFNEIFEVDDDQECSLFNLNYYGYIYYTEDPVIQRNESGMINANPIANKSKFVAKSSRVGRNDVIVKDFYSYLETIPFEILQVGKINPWVDDNYTFAYPVDINSFRGSEPFMVSEFVLVELSKPAIVVKLNFGIFEENFLHNIQGIRVYGGLNKSSMVELGCFGLYNAQSSQMLDLRHFVDKKHIDYIPSKFIKILPIRCRNGPILPTKWVVQLIGVQEKRFVYPSIKSHYEDRQRYAVQLTLKFLRQRNDLQLFHQLSKSSGVFLEDIRLTKLYKMLVTRGDYEACEKYLTKLRNDGLLESYVHNNSKYVPQWNKIDTPFTGSKLAKLSMVIDVQKQIIYAFTIFDMKDALVDNSSLWKYDINEKCWTLLHLGLDFGFTSLEMCLDDKNNVLYLLGMGIFRDSCLGGIENIGLSYNINHQTWNRISIQKNDVNFPNFLSNHHLCFDTIHDYIYIYVGKTIYKDPSDLTEIQTYGGFYRYDVNHGTWRLLYFDHDILEYVIGRSRLKGFLRRLSSQIHNMFGQDFRSRAQHFYTDNTMVFDEKCQLIYIFGGKQLGKYSYNMQIYSITMDHFMAKNLVLELPYEYLRQGYQLCSTIDSETGEIFIFTNFGGDDDTFENCLYVYDLYTDQYHCVYRKHCENPESIITSDRFEFRKEAISQNHRIQRRKTGDKFENSFVKEHSFKSNRKNFKWICPNQKAKVYRLAGMNYSRVKPPNRNQCSMVYDYVNKVNYVFGGYKDANLKIFELWSLKVYRKTSQYYLGKCFELLRRQQYYEHTHTNSNAAFSYKEEVLSRNENGQAIFNPKKVFQRNDKKLYKSGISPKFLSKLGILFENENKREELVQNMESEENEDEDDENDTDDGEEKETDESEDNDEDDDDDDDDDDENNEDDIDEDEDDDMDYYEISSREFDFEFEIFNIPEHPIKHFDFKQYLGPKAARLAELQNEQVDEEEKTKIYKTLYLARLFRFERNELFERLMKYFPKGLTQPQEDSIDNLYTS